MISEIGLLSDFTMVIYIDFQDFEKTNSKLLRVWMKNPCFWGLNLFEFFRRQVFFLISNFEFQEKPSFPIVKMTQKIQKINGIWVFGVSGAAPLEIPALSLESDAPPQKTIFFGFFITWFSSRN